MKRVIYSLYVDIPAEEHYGNSKIKYDTVNKASKTVNAFKTHYKKLIDVKRHYANSIGATFLMYEYDIKYKTFAKNFLKNFPEFTGYEVINFYKIHLLNELTKKYDEILYLDFDVIPLTNESFFESWDLSEGMCVLNQNWHIKKDFNISQSIRSPTAKYFNCHAMLLDDGHSPENDVINTGIIGAKKDDIIKLDFFGKFRDTINLMTKLRSDTSGLYPQNIIDMFRYDNETIFSYKRKINNVKLQWLDNKWHYILDGQMFIQENTKIVHAINKDFDLVWRYYD